jgi:protocatechuate 3,4-dioxygenase beta subunit
MGAALVTAGIVASVSRRSGADNCQKPSRTPILGPYFVGETQEKYDTGDGLIIRGKVLAADCTPISDATIIRWHANRFGVYEEYYRAAMKVKADGSFEMSTTPPGKYANLDRHVHWYVTAPGYTTVVAQIQWTDDRVIESEATFDFSMEKV